MKVVDWFKGLFAADNAPPTKTEFTPGWELTVEGTIQELNKVNTDKSGKNAKYQLYGVIDVIHSELQGADFTVPSSLSFQGKVQDADAAGSISVGERAKLLFKGVGLPQGKFPLKQVIRDA